MIAPTVAVFTVLSGSSNVILSPTLNGVSAIKIDSYLPSFLPISLSAFVSNPLSLPLTKAVSSSFFGEATITSSPVFSLE
mgnify:CR=1 FL=1